MTPPTKVSSLLLGHPIQRSEIELGRLVLYPMYPDDEYYQPAASKPPPQTNTDGMAKPAASIMKVSIQPFNDFSDTLERARGTKLELNLLNLLSLSGDLKSGSNKTTIKSPLCYLHELRNPESYFREVCKEPEACEWMEDASQRPRTNVYLVYGFKTLTDAKVNQTTEDTIDVEPSTTVPVATIASAAAGAPVVLPPGIGDVKASVHYTDKFDANLGYTATGERVYAVMCRKIRFSRFSTRARGPSLEKEKSNCWISYIGGRAESQGEDDGIEADVADSLSLDDLDEEGYDKFEDLGEQILFGDI
ncbi:hypothetical protein F53441_13231 [Fusarium austroafricanum]|uniref:Uncharacterized protein n=1 Tax=Fusarium austroafricanum TaxID=2364996 RepID=A0A8H4JPE6_9HYPO|nr:hypothetical protein F53441_13231 [Fusarium austroafricanum]